MKKFKPLSFLLIIALLAGLLPGLALASEGGPALSVPSAVVMDVDTGEFLFQSDPQLTIAPGGVTTVMTALLVSDSLESGSISLNDSVTVTASALAAIPEGAARSDPALVADEVLTVEDLLYLTVFAGAADAANVLAEYTAGSVDAFVAQMNEKAAQLGCVNTHFLHPHSAYMDGHYTCAYDLALMARAVSESTHVMSVFSAVNHTVNPTAFSDVRQVTTSNLINNPGSSYYYQYIYGFRAAYIPELKLIHTVCGARYNDLDLIVVCTNASSNDLAYGDAAGLFNWAFTSYGYRTLLSNTEILDTIPVDMGSPDSVGVRAEDQIRIVLPVSQELGEVKYDFSYQYEQSGEPLRAPVTVGQYVGDVTVTMDGVDYGTSRLITSTSSDISRTEYLRTQLDTLVHTPAVRQMVTVLLIILAVYLLLVVFYRIQRALHVHSLRRARRDRAISQAAQEIQWLDIPEDQNGVPVVSLPEQESGEAAPQEEAVVYQQVPEDQDETGEPVPEEDVGETDEAAPVDQEEAAEPVPEEDIGEADEAAPADQEEAAEPVPEEDVGDAEEPVSADQGEAEAPVEDGGEYYEEAPADQGQYYDEAPADQGQYYEELPADQGQYYDEAPGEDDFFDDSAAEDEFYEGEDEAAFDDEDQFADEDEEGYFDEDDIDDGPYEP